MSKNVNWANVTDNPDAPARVENTTWAAMGDGDEFYHGTHVYKVTAIRPSRTLGQYLAVRVSRCGVDHGWRPMWPTRVVRRIV